MNTDRNARGGLSDTTAAADDKLTRRNTKRGRRETRDSRQLLLETLNDASGAARTAWLFYLALLAYFLVAIASVSHKDLLLNSPVELPFLGIAIDLGTFFQFAPVVLLVVHFGVYLQHVLLSRKAAYLHDLLLEREAALGLEPRQHPIRLRVHSYSFTQIYAGSQRSRVFSGFLKAIDKLSFVVLPLLLFLAFQITFLPHHTQAMTNWHRVCLFLDLVLISQMAYFMRHPRMDADSHIMSVLRSAQHVMSRVGSVLLVCVSWFVITIPDEPTDQLMSSITPLSVPVPFDFSMRRHCADLTIVPATVRKPFCDTAFGKLRVRIDPKTGDRRAFFLTALMFEGLTDFVAGTATSPFSRNLIVTDQDLSVASTEFTSEESVRNDQDKREVTTERVKLSLRGRDLRFAYFDRSNFTGADFTASNLEGASLRGASLLETNFSCAVKPLRNVVGGKFEACAKLYRANLDGANLRNADLRGGCFIGASLRNADLRGVALFKADLQRAVMTFTRLDGANLGEARLSGAKMLESELRFASFRFAKLSSPEAGFWGKISTQSDSTDECVSELPHRIATAFDREDEARGAPVTDLSKADLQLADLRLADLRGADLTGADLTGADLTLAQMQGARLAKAEFVGADMSFSALHGADLSGATLDGATLVQTRLSGAILRAAKLRSARLKAANLSAADLRFADLSLARFEDNTLTATDLRCTWLPPSGRAAAAAFADKGVDVWSAHDPNSAHFSPAEADELRKRVETYRDLRDKLKSLRQAQRRKSMALEIHNFKVPQRTIGGDRSPDSAPSNDDTQRDECRLRAADAQDHDHSRESDVSAATGARDDVLTQSLYDSICTDVSNARHVFRGVTRRISDSFAEQLPGYPVDPSWLYAKLLQSDERAATAGKNTCIEFTNPRDATRLLLAAKLYEQKRLARPLQ